LLSNVGIVSKFGFRISPNAMTPWRYILASLAQFRRVHVAVAAGVAVGAAVITGALLVGDSMRGSLRDLSLRGLGRVDAVLLAEHPFRAALAGELLDAAAVGPHYQTAVPILLTQGAATRQDDSGAIRRATSLEVFGVPPEFWYLAPTDSDAAASPPSTSDWSLMRPVRPGEGAPLTSRGNQIALTEAVADELGARVGDYVILRLPLAGATPADSVLGEKEETAASRRLTVAAVLPEGETASMARFSLRPSQRSPRNVFVPLVTLQHLLDLPDQANAVALAPKARPLDQPLPDDALSAVAPSLRPRLSDFGLHVKSIPLVEGDAPTYAQISADRLVLPPHVVDVAKKLYRNAGLQPVITYLANTITSGDRQIPYSTVAGVDSTAELGPILDEAGAPIVLADDEVALNDWAAQDLDVEPGDWVTLTFYEPETTHGTLREHPPLRLKVRAILPLADGAGRPTAAADPNFAPELPGVTDQASIDAWELPFELVEEVRDKDEEYWDEHRTTPKAFVSFDLARHLWQTRWGTESVLRIPLPRGERLGEGRRSADATSSEGDAVAQGNNPSPSPSLRGRGMSAEQLASDLRQNLKPAELGMTLIPAKRQALAAASGTTPFDGLFLGFSVFLMASAVMLTSLLFRLGVEQRAREVGLLLATGAAPRRVRRLLLAEALIVAACGALVGAVAGVGYAAVMVHGLNTWWVDATVSPFLELHVRARSIALGFLAGLLVAAATVWWSLRRFARLSARQLLAGDYQPPLTVRRAVRWSGTALPAACLFAAAALGGAAIRWEGEAQAGAFFGGGALALVGVLAAVRAKLRNTASSTPASLTLAGLAVRNARRNPSRTMLSLALAATASFLIVALSAFRLAPTERGTGGFDLLATADVPLHYDLNTPEGRRQFGFTDEDNERLAETQFVGFRVRDGEDASCLNLYQTTQPRVLGAPPELGDAGTFQFAHKPPAPSPRRGALRRGESGGTRSTTSWSLLTSDLGLDANARPVIPMVLDRNTAFYSLKLYKIGDRLTIRDAFDQPVTLQIVALLTNSILQGDVIVSEANFLRLFPDVAGRRFFLIRRGEKAPPVDELTSLLETQLEDFGFDAVDARRHLSDLLAVQNTYLSTFQCLGALGLLLGAVGLAVVQLRSVLERRGEVALMQASGFRRRRLTHMVLAENLVLLVGGLAIGCAAALAAVLPHAMIEPVGAPWRTLAVLLAIVVAAGAAAAWLAARAALRAPLIPALRGE
jgi:ABC-type antimicrobial peptide transport system permease subunit